MNGELGQMKENPLSANGREPSWSAWIAAEARRFFSTKGWLFILGAAVTLPAVGTIPIGTTLGKSGGIALSAPDVAQLVLSAGFTGGLLASIFGALLVTSDFRYRTAGQAMVEVRSRVNWLVAKAVVAVISGLVITTITQASTLAIGLPFLKHANVVVDLWHGQILHMTIGTVLLGLPSALWGVVIGLLIRRQIPTVLTLVIYSVAVEAAILQFVPSLGKFLLGGAQAAIVFDPSLPYHNVSLAVVVFATWIIGLGSMGLVILRRSDIAD